jgi:hypothetical protein
MPSCPTCGQELAAFGDPCPNCGPAALDRTVEAGGDTTLILEEEPGITCPVCGAEHAPADACPACGALHEAIPCEDHPDQTAHSRCVLCGRTVCKRDADPDRRPATCVDHRTVTMIEGWVQVYSSGTEMEAQLLADNLRAEGIDSQLYTQADHIFPVDLGELGIVRLMVPAWEYQQALEVIRAYMDAQGEVEFACPECGEVNEPDAEVCAGCGAALAA